MTEEFTGFSEATLKFFTGLERNNDKKWFEKHREDYDTHVLEPARAFVRDMGERLYTLSPDVIAEPAVNRSLFRLNRDTRFSKDKRPYKTNLGIMFWEGPGKRMECPCFYFHLEKKELMVAVGIYMFPKEMMGRYRDAAADPDSGKELAKIVKDMRKSRYDMGMEHYKKVPRGYDPEHFNEELLRYNGLTAMETKPVPKAFFSGKLVDHCFKRYEKMYPLNRWMLEYMF
jgi:uncharacterized protein (TIGR02453 family)